MRACLPCVPEVFSHGRACKGREVLKRGGVAGGSGDDRRVFHCAVFRQKVDDPRYGEPLLADGDIYAENSFAFLVDDRVEGNNCLAGSAVADDELPLAPSDRDQGVDAL